MKRKLCMALSALMMVSGMAGCGIVAGASDGDVTLRYGIWDVSGMTTRRLHCVRSQTSSRKRIRVSRLRSR